MSLPEIGGVALREAPATGPTGGGAGGAAFRARARGTRLVRTPVGSTLETVWVGHKLGANSTSIEDPHMISTTGVGQKTRRGGGGGRTTWCRIRPHISGLGENTEAKSAQDRQNPPPSRLRALSSQLRPKLRDPPTSDLAPVFPTPRHDLPWRRPEVGPPHAAKIWGSTLQGAPKRSIGRSQSGGPKSGGRVIRKRVPNLALEALTWAKFGASRAMLSRGSPFRKRGTPQVGLLEESRANGSDARPDPVRERHFRPTPNRHGLELTPRGGFMSKSNGAAGIATKWAKALQDRHNKGHVERHTCEWRALVQSKPA